MLPLEVPTLRARPPLALALVLALAAPVGAATDGCARCGVPIGKNPYVLDAWGNRRHVDHDRDAWGRALKPEDWPCAICGRPLPSGSRADHCKACQATAVRQAAEAEAAVARVADWMDAQRLRFVDGPPPVTLVEPGEIDDEHPLDGTDAVALTARTPRWLWHPETREAPLQVRAGLPRVAFELAVARALARAWAWLDGQPPHEPQLRDGAAELVGVSWLVHLGTPEARYYALGVARAANFRHGGGLRRTQAYVSKHGMKGLIALMRARDDFPPGE